MKKLLSSILCLALIITGAFMLTACGNEYKKVAGTYELTSVTMNGETYTKDNAPSYMAESFKSAIVVNADKTFKLDYEGDENDQTGTYVLDGNKITIKMESEEEEQSATIDGNKITITIDDTTMIYTKK